jgi:3-phenylpropionate/trans-cinnamate dioxygenase ferredoxin subunit
VGKFVYVATKNDLRDGEMRGVSVAGQDILLARVGHSYYASDSHCPHLRGNLVRGKLEGTIVSCPLQGSQFDLATGKVIYWAGCTDSSTKSEKLIRSPRPLTVYMVKIEGDKVLVEI